MHLQYMIMIDYIYIYIYIYGLDGAIGTEGFNISICMCHFLAISLT